MEWNCSTLTTFFFDAVISRRKLTNPTPHGYFITRPWMGWKGRYRILFRDAFHLTLALGGSWQGWAGRPRRLFSFAKLRPVNKPNNKLLTYRKEASDSCYTTRRDKLISACFSSQVPHDVSTVAAGPRDEVQVHSLEAWLTSLGLPKYINSFIDVDYADMEMMPYMTEKHFAYVVFDPRHMRRLLAAVEDLRRSSEFPTSPISPTSPGIRDSALWASQARVSKWRRLEEYRVWLAWRWNSSVRQDDFSLELGSTQQYVVGFGLRRAVQIEEWTA